MLNFKDCTLKQLDELFNLRPLPLKRIYGCYVRGRQWHFMALQGKEYAISDSYTATKDELFDILRILKVLKQRIIAQVMG